MPSGSPIACSPSRIVPFGPKPPGRSVRSCPTRPISPIRWWPPRARCSRPVGLRVGLLALELDDPERTARTIATLHELAPGRLVASVDARAATFDREARTGAVATALAGLAPDAELVFAVDDEAGVQLAAAHGRGWLLTRPVSPDAVTALVQSAPDVAGGVYLPIVVHEDEPLARKALDGPLLSVLGAAAGDAAEHIVVGTPDDVLATPPRARRRGHPTGRARQPAAARHPRRARRRAARGAHGAPNRAPAAPDAPGDGA